jgi:Caudovirus prohead serine protease
MTLRIGNALLGLKAAAVPVEIERKTFRGELKQLTDTGDVIVAFAQIGVIDKDGDISQPGSFPTKSVPMSAYGHSSWMGDLPTGRGDIREEGGWAIFDGKFFLDTTAGRDTYLTVKNMAELQEWSYGYLPLDWEFTQREGQDVRILKTQDVYEVSPVIVGAGVGTHTRGIKGRPGAGMPYADHLSLGLEMVKAIAERSKDRVAFRAKEGRTLSSENRARLSSLATALGDCISELTSLLEATDPSADDAGKAASLAHQVEIALARARYLGVSVD